MKKVKKNPAKGKRFSEAVKKEAVKLMGIDTYKNLSNRYGVATSTLNHWKKKYGKNTELFRKKTQEVSGTKDFTNEQTDKTFIKSDIQETKQPMEALPPPESGFDLINRAAKILGLSQYGNVSIGLRDGKFYGLTINEDIRLYGLF